MPSGFAAARPLHRLSSPTARRAAYAARETLAVGPDRILYTPARKRDWVAGGLLLPEAARPNYWTRESLWNAVDARAGATRGRPIAEQPDAQSGMELLLVLPRLTELTIERMSDCVTDFCERFTREGLAVQWDIHVPIRADRRDPDSPPQVSAHAHVIVSGRPIVGDSVARGRIRIFDPVWRVGWRRSIGWSREWRMHQERFYAEHALPLAVPVGGSSERPLGRARFIPAVRDKLLQWRKDRRDALRDPRAILERLTAVRWRFDEADLDALLTSVFPDADERARLRARTLEAAIPVPERPGLFTVRSRLGQCSDVLAKTQRLAVAPSRPVPAQSDDDDLSEALDARLCVLDARDPDAGLDEAITAGARLQALGETVVIVAPTTVSYARARRATRGRVEIRAVQALDARHARRWSASATALIVPEAEALADADLARLVTVTEAAKARLVLIGRCRDADWTGRVLIDDVLMRCSTFSFVLSTAEAVLRAARKTGRLVEALDEAQIVRDAVDDDGILVLGDPDRAGRLGEAMRAERERRRGTETQPTATVAGFRLASGDQLYVTTAFGQIGSPSSRGPWPAGTHLRVIAVDPALDRAIVEDDAGIRAALEPHCAAGTLRRAGVQMHHEALARQPPRMTLILDDSRTFIRTARWCGERKIEPTYITMEATRTFERLMRAIPDDRQPDLELGREALEEDRGIVWDQDGEIDSYDVEHAAERALADSESEYATEVDHPDEHDPPDASDQPEPGDPAIDDESDDSHSW